MMYNQRMTPSLSEAIGLQQVPVNKQAGFTLMELMVVLAILAILMVIGNNTWGKYREATKVDSAKEQIVSLFQQARLKALSSGTKQSVIFDHSTNSGTNFQGQAFSFEGGVDVQRFVCGSCTATDSADHKITFKRRGTTSGSGNVRNVKVSSPNSDKMFIIMVSSVTGRVDVRTSCASSTCS